MPEDIPDNTQDIITEEAQEIVTEDLTEDITVNRQLRKRQPDNRQTWYTAAVVTVVVLVVVFAFIMEAGSNRDPGPSGNGPLPGQSVIQYEIERLDWVEQVFLPLNDYSRPGIKLENINGIVIHNIGNPNTTAMQNRNYFANLAITQETHASSNFIICMDGAVLQCVPVDEIAYASNARNADTLSIELCHPDDTGQFTEDTYTAAVRLTAWLCSMFDLKKDDIIRHFDVQGKECPRFFVDNEDAWEAFKDDVHRLLIAGD